MRFFNPNDNEQMTIITLLAEEIKDISSVYKADFDFNKQGKLDIIANKIELILRPKEIATIIFEK